MKTAVGTALAAGFIMLSVPALAHHGTGTYASTKSVTLSGVFYRVTLTSPTNRKWMKRLDHSMIFVFIAGSYTPFALLALPWEKGLVLFWIVWAGAIAGVLLKMLRTS
jgi:hemolysin III